MIQRSPFTSNNKAKTTTALFTALLFLSGCSTNFAVLDAATIVSSDKTIGDHVVSFVSNKNCSSVRQELGLHYCEEDQPAFDSGPSKHCYRELGRVTCYTAPDDQNPRSTVDQYYKPPR